MGGRVWRFDQAFKLAVGVRPTYCILQLAKTLQIFNTVMKAELRNVAGAVVGKKTGGAERLTKLSTVPL